MKNKVHYKLRRVVSILLASTMLTTSVPLHSFAAGTNSAGSSDNGQYGQMGSDYGSDRPRSRIGIRLSLVNSRTGEVMSVDEKGNPMVLDYVFTDKDTFKELTGLDVENDVTPDVDYTGEIYKTPVNPDHLFTSIRTQSLKSLQDFAEGDPSANNIHIITADDEKYLDGWEEQFGGLTPLGGDNGKNIDYPAFASRPDMILPWNHTGSDNSNFLFKGRGQEFTTWCRTLNDGKIWNGQLHQIIDANGNVTNVGISAVADDVLKSMQAQYPGSKFDRVETSKFTDALSEALGIGSDFYAQLVTSTDTAIMTGKTEDIKSELANIKENVNSNTYTAKMNGVDVEGNSLSGCFFVGLIIAVEINNEHIVDMCRSVITELQNYKN